MILITGVTGTVGGAVSAQLQSMGVAHRALVRDVARAAGGPGVTPVAGDLARPETLAAGLAGVEKAFLMSPPVEQGLELEKNFITAAKRAGVRHVVKLSAIHAAPDAGYYFARQHGLGEQALEASGMAYTMLRPNGFYQNFLGSADSIKNRNALTAPAGDMRFSTVDVRDIAAVAAQALTGSGHEGERYTITGPVALSHQEIAAIFTAVLGREIAYVDVPPEAARGFMIGSGIPAWNVDKILDLFAHYRTGAAAMVTDVVEKVGGKAPIQFEAFVRDAAAAFQP